LEGKGARAREAYEARMKERPNDIRVRVFQFIVMADETRIDISST
jgi:hypothetical protein